MNKYIYSGISFVVGVAVGAAPTYLYLKKDFEKSLNKAVEDVKSTYRKQTGQWFATKPIPNCGPAIKLDELIEPTVYTPSVEIRLDEPIPIDPNYISTGAWTVIDKTEESELLDKSDETYIDWDKQVEIDSPPELITAEECGADPYRFSTLMLTYFADEVLADDDYIPLAPEEFEPTIGMDAKKLADAFNDEGWEDDHLYVRNFKRNIDYEIAYSYETYEEYLEKHPYLTE